MMKNVFVILIAMVLFSCSNSNSPEDSNDSSTQLMPNSIGNYWVYEHRSLDKVIGIDSMVLTQHFLYKSKEASLLEVFRFDNDHELIKKDSIFYAEDAYKLFVIEKLEGSPWYDNTWIQIYGEKTDSWVAARFKANKENLLIKDSIFTTSYDNVLTGKYIYSDVLPIAGEEMEFKHFSLKNDFKGSFYKYVDTDKGQDSVRFESVRTFDQYLKIVRGVGIIEKVYPSYYFAWYPTTSSYGFGSITSFFPDVTSILIRYNIK